jgi:hypothetical protein
VIHVRDRLASSMSSISSIEVLKGLTLVACVLFVHRLARCVMRTLIKLNICVGLSALYFPQNEVSVTKLIGVVFSDLVHTCW